MGGRFEMLELSAPPVPDVPDSRPAGLPDVRERADRCLDDGAYEEALRLYSRALAECKQPAKAPQKKKK